MRIKMVAFTLVLLLVLPAQAFAGWRTFSDLSADVKYLKSGLWTKSYVSNKFDCSNMSALLDFCLDYLGHDSWIMPGTVWRLSPDNKRVFPVGNHVMVLVFTSDKGPWWVESTNLTLTPANSLAVPFPNRDLFVPHLIFMSFDQAARFNQKEFGWTEEDVERVLRSIRN